MKLKPHWMLTSVMALVLFSMSAGALALYVARDYWMPPMSVAQASTKQESQTLQAMTERMAEIQARMMRIDALGAHLAEDANLKGEEFDFSKHPPMGGPDIIDESAHNDHSKTLDSETIQQKLSSLWDSLQAREARLQALDHTLRSMRDTIVDLSNMPVRDSYITSGFGYRADPFTGKQKMHAGIDFAGTKGTDVYAVADGVVQFAGFREGYGNTVDIHHGDGYVTRYAHAESVVVATGDLVSKDQLVAHMGSTGRSTGTHLHFEVMHNGRHVNPRTVMQLAKR